MKLPSPFRRQGFLLKSVLATLLLTPFTPSQAAEPGKAVTAMGDGLQAGAAAVDISPDQWPLSLRGSFTPRASSAINDPLHSRAIAFKSGEGKVVIAVVDNLMIDRDTLDAIKQKAAEATGWRADEMLIAATHTHTAPSVGGTGGTKAAAAYREKAQAGILKSLTDAVAGLQPATVAFGKEPVPDEVYNRRWYLQDGTMPPNPFGGFDKVKTNPDRKTLVKPAGPTDPDVSVVDVRTRNKGGKPLALLANYALHYVGGMPPDTISADYFGEYARVMAARAGGSKPAENYVAMVSNGTSGDINNIDFPGTRPPREPFEQIRLVAAKVADASWRAVRNAQRQDRPFIAIRQREIDLLRRRPTEAEIEAAKKIIALPESDDKDLPRNARSYAFRTISASQAPEKMPVIL
ncbi:MAG: hypothetical protein ACAI34_08355, partial [Verrucomicrobium sp.]